MTVASALTLAYLVGSIPFAFLLARRIGGVDLRTLGSGNLGAANVFRTTRLSAALLVVALDGLKGAAAAWMGQRLAPGDQLAAGCALAAIVGHIYPVWLRFRGGKGVATASGAFAVLAPAATLVAAALFVAVVWTTRFVSLGSLVGTVVLPPLAWWFGAGDAAVTAAAVAAGLVIFRHRSNLARMLRGTERRLGQRA